MSIQIVKLVNDEDVIAEVVDGENEIELKMPVRMFPTQQGLGMMPMCPFSKDKSFKIKKTFVVFTAAPEDEIKNAYNEKFGSGIVVASPAQATGLKLHI